MGLTGTRSDACMDLDSGAKVWGKAAEMLASIAFGTDTTGDTRAATSHRSHMMPYPSSCNSGPALYGFFPRHPVTSPATFSSFEFSFPLTRPHPPRLRTLGDQRRPPYCPVYPLTGSSSAPEQVCGQGLRAAKLPFHLPAWGQLPSAG